ncbi:MAG: 6-bladed beta-propeller [Saprospiraceae bacterium]|nr:6-bladed beta-propeller [Saprospiraceae bacterium]
MKFYTSRRKFIKKSVVCASLAMSIPHASFAIHNKRAMVGEIVGHANFKYRIDKHWGIQDPGNIPVRNCHEMVQDRSGRLLMTTNHTKNNVIIYDKQGVVLETWGHEYPGIHGLTLADEGSQEVLFFTDTERHQIFKTTLSGRELMVLDYPLETGVYQSPDQFQPTEVAVADNGDFYVADGYGENYIIQYDSKGQYIRHFGGRGSEAHQFDCCHGITIDTRKPGTPTLLITSRTSQEFKRFTMEGEYLETIKVPGCWICRPVIQNELLYFAVLGTKSWWEYDGLVIILDEDNRIISAPGGVETDLINGAIAEVKYDGRSFMNPHDICVDRDENLYVPQWFSGNTYPIKLDRV